MRAVRVLLVGVLGLLGSLLLVTGAAGPAAACSCISSTLRQSFDRADVVVTGVLVDVGAPASRGVAYTVDVDTTYKGEPRREVVFRSPASGASCGVERLEVDRRYTFFLARVRPGVSRFLDLEPGDLTSSLCSGNRRSADRVDARVVALGATPARPPGQPVASPVAPALVPASARSHGPSRWWLPATGAVLTGLAGLVAWAGLRRTSS